MSTVRNVARLQESQARVDDLGRHHLGAIGPGVHVAVMTGLVAPLADVDLQDLDRSGAERIVAGAGGSLLERVRDRQRRERGALRRGIGEGMPAVGECE